MYLGKFQSDSCRQGAQCIAARSKLKIIGIAAGTAAVLANKNGVAPKKVNIGLLQDTLHSQGVLVSVKDVRDEILEPYRAMKELSLMAGKPELHDELAKY